MKTNKRPRHESWRAAAACLGLLATGIQVPAHGAPARGTEFSRAPSAASAQETTGVATGLAVGAVAGGPFGAILSAAAGAWIGDRMHRSDAARDAARQRLDAQGRRLAGLGATALFRTGDDRLRPEDAVALRHLAEVARDRPDLLIRVSGFADPRGPAQLNDALSARRAAAAAQVFVEAGLDPARISVAAYGAALSAAAAPGEAAADDHDGYAFERRVSVRLEKQAAATADAAVARRD
jgi:outer membrane protein OmpA-like peptidoglycan-associated protein